MGRSVSMVGDAALEGVEAVPLLRSKGSEARSFFVGLGALWVEGTNVDWGVQLRGAGARRVDLPAYAFQRERFWLDGVVGGDGDVRRAGQVGVDHPMLSAVVGVAGSEGCLFAGRISADSPEWIADHVVMGSVVVPGVALVEMALRVAEQLRCDWVEELVLESPLVLAEGTAVRLQVAVEPDSEGRRAIKIYSQPEDATAEASLGERDEWTCHATGTLTHKNQDTPTSEIIRSDTTHTPPPWPPPNTTPIDTNEFYDGMAAAGFDYGSAFLGVTGLWQRGEELFAEVRLPDRERVHAPSYGLHPALFDAAIQAIGANSGYGSSGSVTDGGGLRLPFAFGGVRLFGAGSSVLRVHLVRVGVDEFSMLATDEDGALVAWVSSLLLRTVTARQLALAGSARESLFGLDWSEAPVGSEGLSGGLADGELVLLGGRSDVARGLGAGVEVFDGLASLREALDRGRAVPGVVLVDCAGSGFGGDGSEVGAGGVEDSVWGLLELLGDWLADERLVASRLVLITRGGVSVGGQDVRLSQAPLWGLVRSAQAENPGRFVLLDIDGDISSGALAAVLGSGESQLAVREDGVLVPRVTRLHAPGGTAGAADSWLGGLDPERTVLITGGTGALGGVLARHMVLAHGARNLLLVGRRGRQSAGAQELERELVGLGAQVRIEACDVADREALQALLGGVGEEHPLGLVVHLAGVLDDGVVGSLSRERVERVLAPKVLGAWNLHELTKGSDLSGFVLFSSAAATLGSAGQGAYAAANAFLDGLAAHRRAQGLAGVSLGWGAWAGVEGMADQLQDADLARITRSGVAALGVREGLDLLDAAAAHGDRELILPVRLDVSGLREQAEHGSLPAVLAGLAGPASRQSVKQDGVLARRLAGVSADEREGVLLEVVREEIARVLGHPSSESIGPERALSDLGFDSLMAVELRNNLNALTGLRLPTTLVFDYPSPASLTAYLLDELLQSGPAGVVSATLPAPTLSDDEPIAIVGMSCRYPGGVGSPAELWDLVMGEVDAVCPFPQDRGWDLEKLYDPDPDTPGTSYAREGGFLHDPADFDPEFFSISPREALAMDPQQRLLLETSWEALENAQIDPNTLRGSQTGVFAGASPMDYGANLWSAPRGREDLAGYWLTGSAGSVVSGRVSYVFGLEGPSVSVDTACSSSLVALHLACQALRSGECPLALAGGVTVLDTPGLFVQFSGQRGMARDGRCKSFSESADGVGWGEGVGVLVLERLSDAQRNGRRVLGVVRGSAINQDGASNGLTAPNGPSQQRVIEQALAKAKLLTAEVDAVEGHGTGTTLGDPIEANALLATYGHERPENNPLWLGSVKSNIGHSVAAAGVAGVIKMVMAMRHGVLPRTLHVDEPSSKVDWDTGAVALLTERREWVREDEPRRAGVSSFGVSGTNAHVILEEAPVAELESAVDGAPAGEGEESVVGGGLGVWVLSGRGGAGLAGQAGRLLEWVGVGGVGVGDVGLSLLGRSVFDDRAVVVGDRDELLGGLRSLAVGEVASGVVRGSVGGGGGVAFMFTGQGAQRLGMGRGLCEEFPVFGEVFEGVCSELDGFLECRLRDVLWADEGSLDVGLLDRTVYAQAGLFALEVALFGLVESFGVRPDFLIGHSIGELAAAHVAGVFSLGDACALVAARGRLMGALPEGGAMVAIAAPEVAVLETLDGLGGSVSVAAVNAPGSVVVSGEEGAVGRVAEVWRDRGVRTKRLRVSHAFHSSLMDGMLEEFGEAVSGLSFGEPGIPIVSNVTGMVAGVGELSSAAYWVDHVRRTVRFADGIRCLVGEGVTRFLELGPDGTLSSMVGDAALEGVEAVPLLRSKGSEARSFFVGLGALWVEGTNVDWGVQLRGAGARRVDLPAYAFQRERFWLDGVVGGDGDVRRAGQVGVDHPMLSAVVGVAGSEGCLFAGRISADSPEWIADHVVMGSVVVPGVALVEMALRVAEQLRCDWVEELVLESPLVLAEGTAVRLQVAVEPDSEGRRAIKIYSQPEDATAEASLGERDEWTCHATGTLTHKNQDTPTSEIIRSDTTHTPPPWPPPNTTPIDTNEFYEEMSEVGLEYGPAFLGVKRLWQRGEELFAEVRLSDEERKRAGSYGFHPALFDAAIHGMGAKINKDARGASTVGRESAFAVCVRWGGVVRFWCFCPARAFGACRG